MALKFLERFKAKAAGESTPARTAEMLQRAQSLQRDGQLEKAIELYDAVILRAGDHVEACYKRANAKNALGRWEAALADYDRAIALDPGHAKALCNRGAVLERLDRCEEALASYDRAIGLDPGDFLAYYNRGSALKKLKRVDEALASYERAVALKSDYVEAFINRGNLLQELREHEAAVASYDRAIELKPIHAEAFLGRGLALFALRRFDEALASYEQAIGLKGDYAEAYINRGIVLHELQRHDAAIESYERGIALDPARVEAYAGLGNCLNSLGLIEAAIVNYNRALALQADRKYVLGMRRHAQMHICEWDDLERDLVRITQELNARKPVSTPLPVLALIDSAPLHRLAAEIWVREECPPDDTLGAIPARMRADKIRVAYFSADFRSHAVAMLTAELFETHDRSRFEITAYAFGREANDPVRARLECAFDRFVDVRKQSDKDVALLARKAGVDIAVDLGGFTEHSRTRIFALRAAPIQVSYIGYLGTLGAPYMDYLVADAAIIPAEQRQHYSEKIIYLPSYQANDSQRRIAERTFTREELGLPPAGFVFSCFNANYKITPRIFGAWMRILGRVQGSSLFLYADHPIAQRNLLKAARGFGVDPGRIVFGKRLALEDYLARFRSMDLFLDTLPYNAGTIASDALWAGLPVLTCAGEAFAGRVGASLVRAIGLPDLITTTLDAYEEAAVRLATNPAEMARIRQELAHNRAAAPLFDTARFTKNLESAYSRIYERYLENLPPDHVYPQD